jgi:hypothetical protein
MIDTKFARLRTYRNNIHVTGPCLKPSFQTLSANSSKGAWKKIGQRCKCWPRRPFRSRSNSPNHPPSFRLRLEDGSPTETTPAEPVGIAAIAARVAPSHI